MKEEIEWLKEGKRRMAREEEFPLLEMMLRLRIYLIEF